METFELCKRLHKLKPDWTTEDKLSIQVTGHPPGIVRGYNFIAYSDEAPRFTLEYLLDKQMGDFYEITIYRRQS